MKITVISPHLDDAVWSLCEHMMTWMENGDDVEILTVFAGVPPEEPHTAKYKKLHREHANAITMLSAWGEIQGWNLNFFDDAARRSPTDVGLIGVITREVANVLQTSMCEVVVAPTGIHHPDHLLANAAIAPLNWAKVWLYDELPYYVDYPHLLDDPHGLESPPWRAHEEEKRAVAALYKSQIDPPGNLWRRIMAPERCWVAR